MVKRKKYKCDEDKSIKVEKDVHAWLMAEKRKTDIPVKYIIRRAFLDGTIKKR